MPPASSDHVAQQARADPASEKLWYRDGLRFSCTSCGRCCSGASGYVWVEIAEIRTMATYLGLELDEFGRRYLRRVGGRYALLEKQAFGDCVFLDEDHRCSLYAARPHQCRAFPWWPAHVASPQAWSDAALECEGIGPHGELVAASAITEALGRRRP